VLETAGRQPAQYSKTVLSFYFQTLHRGGAAATMLEDVNHPDLGGQEDGYGRDGRPGLRELPPSTVPS
jgi:hypothetical protein